MSLHDNIVSILDSADARILSLETNLSQANTNLAQTQAALEQARAEHAAYVESHPHSEPGTTTKQSLAAVRVFPSYRDKVYGNHAAVLARLGNLGVKRISHKFTPTIAGLPEIIKFTQDAYNLHGIKSWLTMGEPRVALTAADWDKMVNALTGPLAGMVERVYGWNEPNHVRGGGTLPPDWPAMTGAHQAELYRRIAPLGIKVGTPQLWSGNLDTHDADLTKLAPEIRGKFDHIGWHLYPRSGGAENTKNVDRFDAIYKSLFGTGFQVICTEAGYLDAANYTGGAHNNTPQEKAAKIGPLLDEYINRGYGISYFELLDDPDPTEANREASLGLVEAQSIDPATWTNKPAFAAFKNHLA